MLFKSSMLARRDSLALSTFTLGRKRGTGSLDGNTFFLFLWWTFWFHNCFSTSWSLPDLTQFSGREIIFWFATIFFVILRTSWGVLCQHSDKTSVNLIELFSDVLRNQRCQTFNEYYENLNGSSKTILEDRQDTDSLRLRDVGGQNEASVLLQFEWLIMTGAVLNASTRYRPLTAHKYH